VYLQRRLRWWTNQRWSVSHFFSPLGRIARSWWVLQISWVWRPKTAFLLYMMEETALRGLGLHCSRWRWGRNSKASTRLVFKTWAKANSPTSAQSIHRPRRKTKIWICSKTARAHRQSENNNSRSRTLLTASRWCPKDLLQLLRHDGNKILHQHAASLSIDYSASWRIRKEVKRICSISFLSAKLMSPINLRERLDSKEAAALIRNLKKMSKLIRILI